MMNDLRCIVIGGSHAGLQALIEFVQGAVTFVDREEKLMDFTPWYNLF
ncbi:hypothetical protein MKX50_12685 [Paenibacillus sp. FSL W8-0186]